MKPDESWAIDGGSFMRDIDIAMEFEEVIARVRRFDFRDYRFEINVIHNEKSALPFCLIYSWPDVSEAAQPASITQLSSCSQSCTIPS